MIFLKMFENVILMHLERKNIVMFKLCLTLEQLALKNNLLIFQRLERDRTACSTEEDRRVLRFTRESFESRWENVSKTAQTRKRQSEERFVLCKEFWNEFHRFVEWLDETEKALGTALSGKSSFGSPRSKLKIYEVSAQVAQTLTLIAHFRYIKYSASLQGCEAVKLNGKEISSYSLGSQCNFSCFSLTASD
jgi:hypothetical protein